MHRPVDPARSRSTRSARGSRGSRRAIRALRIGFSYIIVWRGAVARRRRDPREHRRDRDGDRARARASASTTSRSSPCSSAAPSGAEVMDPARRRAGPRARGGADPRRGRARRRALADATLQRPREHQPARARGGQLARAHAPAAHLPHAGAAPGADAAGPLQLPRAPRRRARRGSPARDAYADDASAQQHRPASCAACSTGSTRATSAARSPASTTA